MNEVKILEMNLFDIVKIWFESFGYQVLEKPNPHDTNCDMFVIADILQRLKHVGFLG